MRVEIKKGTACGTVSAPPSKSYTHRALLCAALSAGESVIENVYLSDDVKATLGCISALGREYRMDDDRIVFPQGGMKPRGEVFPCAESASTLRFFIPAALALSGEAVFECSPRLTERGIGVYEKLFAEKGISVKKERNAVIIRGELAAGEYSFPGNISSQYASGLLMALPMLRGNSALRLIPPVESRPYIGLTLDVMRTFGVSATEERENSFLIRGGQRYNACRFAVEGDWSNAAALLLMNHIGGDVKVSGLDGSSLQGDRVCVSLFKELKSGGTADISNCPDLGPIMMAAAAIFGGGTVNGTRRLSLKESDRANAMAAELGKLGVSCAVGDNSVTVLPGSLRASEIELDGHGDHRIVMALAALLSITGGALEGAEAVSKSWGGFFGALRSLGMEISEN